MKKLTHIEHPLTGASLCVAIKDFKIPMTWPQAVQACKDLGNGWRLPNIDELEAIYHQLHKKKIGDFKNKWYWSSTPHSDQSIPNAWVFKFDQGISNGYTPHDSPQLVRAIFIE